MTIEPRRGGRAARRSSVPSVALGLALGLAASILVTAPSEATPGCPTSLSQSTFEIDASANAQVDTTGCLDWYDPSTSDRYLTGVIASNDQPTGSGDDSFQGASEGDLDPSLSTGSIPPNKSDLKTFGVYAESATPKVLALFWARVQDPKGTTNMDFELNQKFCDPSATPTNCSGNGVTPVRTDGDKLITYDLSKGGTVPTISIREWTASGWSGATVLTGGTGATAIGSVNTTAILATASPFGAADPFTFGEAAISYAALFPTGAGCLSLGSAYLKSRSSDSFSSALKDFIAPQRVAVSNCSTLSTTATASPVTLGNPISDTATLGAVTATAGGTVTFTVYSDAACLTPVATSSRTVAGPGSYTSDPYTPTDIGTYYWIASYSGDPDNAAVSGSCGDPNESTRVTKAASTLTTAQLVYPQDTATVGGGTATPTGTVTFNLYGPGDPTCAGTPAYTQQVTLVGGTAATSNTTFSVAAATAGQYRWSSSYSGDATHDVSSSPCGVETFTISIDDDSTTP